MSTVTHALTPRDLCDITVQSLDPLYVIWMQLEVGAVSVVHRCHQCAVVLGVAQAQSVANLVGCNDPQVGAIGLPFCPHFIFVKMHDT